MDVPSGGAGCSKWSIWMLITCLLAPHQGVGFLTNPFQLPRSKPFGFTVSFQDEGQPIVHGIFVAKSCDFCGVFFEPFDVVLFRQTTMNVKLFF